MWAIALALVLLATLGGGTATAEDHLNRAGLVVRHGDGRLTYAYLAFPEEEIPALELLRRSGLDLVTVSFGGLGEGVCSLEGEGCPASECRRRLCQGSGADDPFWQYFRQTAPGQWTAMALGASAARVRDGDVDGWSWTGTGPNLPAVTLAEVARLAGVTATEDAPAGVPTPAVRTVFPAGYAPPTEKGQGWVVYAAAGAIVLGIGAGALVATRRRRPAGAPE